MRSSIMVRCGSRVRRLAALGTVVGLTLSLRVAPARAAEGDKAVARAHYETATRMYEVREYGEALKEYKAAYIAKPDPAFLFNIGQCYRKMDKDVEALDFFEQYLKKAAPDDPNRAQVEARIRNIKAGRTSAYDPFEEQDGAKRPRSPEDEASQLAPERPAPPAWQPPLAAPRPAPLVAPASAPGAVPPVQPTAVEAAPPVFFAPGSAPLAQPAGVELAATAAANEETHGSSPFYKTWWFWTGVGAAVVAGTVTAVLLSSRGGGGTEIPETTLGSRPVLS